MACTLTITGVTGITTGGTLTSIVVTGQATNCNSVTVQIECGTGQPQKLTNVPVDTSTGTWTATFQAVPESCVCSKLIRVVALCDDQLQSCHATFNKELECVEGGGQVCPSIVSVLLSPGDCNPDGTRTVQITCQLDSTSSYSAHLVDSSNNTIGVPLSNVSGPQTLSGGGNYAGTETFRVIVTQPTGCPASIPFSVQIPACLTCPSVTIVPTISPVPNSPDFTVVVTATLDSPSPYTAELREGANTLDSLPIPAAGTRTMVSPSESLPANTSRTYDVVITSPTTCGITTLMVPAPGNDTGNGTETETEAVASVTTCCGQHSP